MATSIKRPRPTSCHPKGDFVLFYTSIIWPGRFEFGRFQPDEGKRIMTIWNAVKIHFLQYFIETITKQSLKAFKFFCTAHEPVMG